MPSLVDKLAAEIEDHMISDFGVTFTPLRRQRLRDRCALIIDKLGSAAEVDTPLNPASRVREKATGRLGVSSPGGFGMSRRADGTPDYGLAVHWDDGTGVVVVDPTTIEFVKPL